jgi:hypothetical protein
MCGNPRCRHILTLELHHIVWVKEGGGNEATNLIALCPNCHSLHTHGHIPKSTITHWKGILHALNHAFNKQSIDLLLFLQQSHEHFIWYSGDGVLHFASLIASGFVRIAETRVATGYGYGEGILAVGPSSAHLLQLTEKGTAFVQTWLDGDAEQHFSI